MEKIKSISVQQYDLIRPNTKISIESKVPIEPKSAQSSILLRGVPGIVQLNKNAKVAIWKPVSAIPEGFHIFEIGELIFNDGTKQEDLIKIPLLVLDSKSKISENLQVLNVSRIQIQDTKIKRIPLGPTQANYVELIKAVGKDGHPVEMAFDSGGNKVDINNTLGKFYKKYQEKYGKIHESLFERLRNKKDDEVPIAIWLDIAASNIDLKDKKDKTFKESDEDIKIVYL